MGSSPLAHALPPGRYRTSVLLRLSYHELRELSRAFSIFSATRQFGVYDHAVERWCSDPPPKTQQPSPRGEGCLVLLDDLPSASRLIANRNLLRVYIIIERVNADFFVDEAGPEVDQVFVGGNIHNLDGAGDDAALAGHQVIESLAVNHARFQVFQVAQPPAVGIGVAGVALVINADAPIAG